VGPGGFFDFGELKLTLVIFVFGIAALVVFYLLLKAERSTPFTLRLYVVMLIVFGTLLVVSSGYSSEELTPVVGLFGTIAGYLMGRAERSDAKPE
jgi:hydrogenase/urease accessory protein HupE